MRPQFCTSKSSFFHSILFYLLLLIMKINKLVCLVTHHWLVFKPSSEFCILIQVGVHSSYHSHWLNLIINHMTPNETYMEKLIWNNKLFHRVREDLKYQRIIYLSLLPCIIMQNIPFHAVSYWSVQVSCPMCKVVIH